MRSCAIAILKSASGALLAGCLYALFFLINLRPSIYEFGGEFISRIGEDKFTARFVFLPVALCLAFAFLEGRRPRYLAAFTFVCLLDKANFMNANLELAKLCRARAKGCFFGGAVLRKSNLSGARLRSAQLAGADLSESLLSDCDLRYATMNRANLRGAFFTDADLSYANLSHADGRAADFSGANLAFANLHALREEDTRWTGAALGKARRTDIDRLEAEAWQPPPRPRQAR